MKRFDRFCCGLILGVGGFLFVSAAPAAEAVLWRLPIDAAIVRPDGRQMGRAAVFKDAGRDFLRLSCVKTTNDWGASFRIPLGRDVPVGGRLMYRCRVRLNRRFEQGAGWGLELVTRHRTLQVGGQPSFIDWVRQKTFPAGEWIDCEEDVPVSTNVANRLCITLSTQRETPGTVCELDVASFELFLRPDAELEAKRAAWLDFRRTFRPDYSDGSAYLRPAEGHRLAKPFPVATDGKPSCQILLARTPYWYERLANKTTERAATELQRLLKAITGAEVPIRDTNARVKDVPAIFLGKGCFRFGGSHTWWKNRPPADDPVYRMEEDLAKLEGTDGYAICAVGDDLYVFGVCEKGTLNGVYALVENNTDFISVRPDRTLGEIFSAQPTLAFVWGHEVLERPAIPHRGFWNILHFEYWCANGCTTSPYEWGGRIPYTRGGHNVLAFVPPFSDHPEFFGLRDGRRDKAYGNSLCFGRADFDAVSLDYMMRCARAVDMSALKGISVSLDDTRLWCDCADCQKPMTLEDGTVVRPADADFMSTRYFLWLDKMARAVGEAFPGKGLTTLAYFQTAEPPRCAVASNIEVGYCPYERARESEPVFMATDIRWLRRLRDWSKKVPRRNLYLRGYDGLGLEFPLPLAHSRARDLKEYFRYVSGINSETTAYGADEIDRKTGQPRRTREIMDLSAIEFWVMMRLYWNPEQDVEQLYKKFCTRAYREAAKPMERFYGTIRERILRGDAKIPGGCSTEQLFRLFFPTEVRASLQSDLAEAEKAAVHPKSEEIIRRIRAKFDKIITQVETSKKKGSK